MLIAHPWNLPSGLAVCGDERQGRGDGMVQSTHRWKVSTLALGMGQLRSKSTVEVCSPSLSQSKAMPKGKMSTTSKSRTLHRSIPSGDIYSR